MQFVTIFVVVSCDDVKYLFCPQYEGLGIKEIQSFASEYPIME